ncbi:MAG: hypothetical protein GOVbin568_10 [Prokaryotic dsDNA virus sp.]|nr:MAG: hypothetical protein GOVbin568_10 [Prokaryotic dsDNA virus sp.]|tara:strand:- start:4322 stop:4960 length:639 start_codon:yes stop_codon:yes gene_type:complete
MDLKTRIRVALGIDKETTEKNEVQLMMEDKLADGTIIVSEADELAAGVVINILSEDGVQTPLPEGNYTTEAGVEFTVDADGVVLEVAEAEETEAEEEEKQYEDKEEMTAVEKEIFAEVGAVVKELLEEVRKDIARISGELDELRGENLAKDENIAELQEENTNLSAQVKELGEQPADKAVSVNKFATQKVKLSKADYDKLDTKERFYYNLNK